jgi:hypothetical protein
MYSVIVLNYYVPPHGKGQQIQELSKVPKDKKIRALIADTPAKDGTNTLQKCKTNKDMYTSFSG